LYIIGIAVLVLAGLVVLWAVAAYNSLIRLKNQVENAWRQVDVQLKRRHDLIPNLVQTVKGAMEFERETLSRVIEARSRAAAARSVADKGLAEGFLSQALGKLFALVESYPELKSNANVLRLQEELTSTENRVGFARQFYNDIVAGYNTAQGVFPTMIIATLFGFRKATYFHAEPGAREVPGVDLSLK